MLQNSQIQIDALSPADMAVKATQVGVKKASLDWVTTFLLAILAGAFIAVGAIFSTTVTSGVGDKLAYGIVRLVSGVSFSLGLILVVVGGAELFTGNNLLSMAWIQHEISTAGLLRNWAIVYLGNFVGAVATAALTFLSGQYMNGNGAVGLAALTTANAKVHLGFFQAIFLGILCNALVCLAVWLTYSARTTTDKILAIIPPITAFVAAGYEHSVANMYFIPVGMFIQQFAPASFWTAIGKTADAYASINFQGFLVGNLLPVTIGNIIGGAIMVGAVYWFAYLRHGKKAPIK